MLTLAAVSAVRAFAALGVLFVTPGDRTASVPATRLESLEIVAAPPAAADGSLNIEARAAARDLVIRVNTLGGPPVATESDPIWLVNDEGLSLTKVFVLDPRSPRCLTAETHFVPVGPAPYTANDDWCLDIRLPPYGSQVSGDLHGRSVTIAITVEHQAAWGWPIFWASLGLAVALLVVLLSSSRFPSLAPRFHIRRILSNEARKDRARHPTKLDGLTHQWRREATRGGQHPVRDVVSHRFARYLTDVVAHGPDREDRARRDLRRALRNLPEDSPLRPLAEQEANRRDYHITDFFDDRFRPRALPAVELLAKVNDADTPGRSPSGDPTPDSPAPTEAAAGDRVGPRHPLVHVTGEGFTIFLGLLPMLVAGASALVSVYLTNKTFGTWTDYLALTVTTAGTSAAAAAAAALVRTLGSTPLAEPATST